MTLPSIDTNPSYPFLKWAGGKRWLTANSLSLFPNSYRKYYEPFLGSGAVFFSLRPSIAVLNDINRELIDCYKAIRDNPSEVKKYLEMHHLNHSKSYYYQVRQVKPTDLLEKAARFIYLNRTCWNALYRVNQKGEFNVPMGTKTNVLLNTDDFEQTSSVLKNVSLTHLDFEEVIDQAQEGDLIFADPPYTVKHNFNGFVKYNEKFFHWDDQVRLSECLTRAKNRGCHVVLTNAHHPSIFELYENEFEIIPMTRNSVIAASSANRGIYEEVVIRNFG